MTVRELASFSKIRYSSSTSAAHPSGSQVPRQGAAACVHRERERLSTERERLSTEREREATHTERERLSTERERDLDGAHISF